MTTHAEQVVDGRQRCWCCDQEFGPEDVVHLGAHPEVALCFDCARWVRRRAVQRADAGRGGIGVRLRGYLARIRAVVIGRGWHDRPGIGAILRWIDRRLP